MTPKERAAMQQALEALESCNVGNWSMAFDEFAVVEAITALREALAKQAEQEPVGVIGWAANIPNTMEEVHWEDECPPIGTTLYATPVRTKDLTDDEIYTLYSEPCSDREMVEFARAVIAADREKNK